MRHADTASDAVTLSAHGGCLRTSSLSINYPLPNLSLGARFPCVLCYTFAVARGVCVLGAYTNVMRRWRVPSCTRTRCSPRARRARRSQTSTDKTKSRRLHIKNKQTYKTPKNNVSFSHDVVTHEKKTQIKKVVRK